MIHYRTITGPLGDVLWRAEGGCLTGAFFAGQKYHPGVFADAAAPDTDAARLFDAATHELQEYFAGVRQRFTVPLAPVGSRFQQDVWRALLAIPFGETTTYGALAARLGLPGGHARAVGGAVGRNPISVIVPCHRVLGSQGALTGYAGGVPRKLALLRLEGIGIAMAGAHDTLPIAA